MGEMRMKCIHCGKDIKYTERYLIHGSGDFIHEDCAKYRNDEMTRISNMSDLEFEMYMGSFDN